MTRNEKIDFIESIFPDAVIGALDLDEMYEIAVRTNNTRQKMQAVFVEEIRKGDEIKLRNPERQQTIRYSVCAGSNFPDIVERYEAEPWGWFTKSDDTKPWQTKGKVIDNGKIFTLDSMKEDIQYQIAIGGFEMVSHKHDACF